MARMFLSSYFSAVAKHLPAFLGEDCTGKTVSFIPVASKVEKMDFFVAGAMKAFRKLGMEVDELDISTLGRDELSRRLAVNDYIYVSGGNTFYLLQELIKSGADMLIKDAIAKGTVYIGESAGSVILAKNIEYVKLMDDPAKAPDLVSFESLGLVDFYPVPHQGNFPFKKAVEKVIREYGSALDLRPFNNKQVITIDGDRIHGIGMLQP